jgi:hypothetical protein
MAELFRSVKYFFIYPDPYQTQFLGSKHVWCFEITVFVRRETLGSKPPASDVGEKTIWACLKSGIPLKSLNSNENDDKP